MTSGGTNGCGPRLCFVGPMVGRNPGYVTTQGEVLARFFETAGHRVLTVSSNTNRYVRLADIIATLVARRREIDVVTLDVYSGPSFVVEDVASLLARQFQQRVVMRLHGGALPEFFARFPSWTLRVLTRAAVLVAPSEFLARAVASYGLKARVIPNVIDLSEYPYRHRQTVRPRLFWMRSFHRIYNPLLAIRTLARVRTTWPEATLVMAGQDKGLEAQTRRLAEELGLTQSVSFPGFLDAAGKAREGQAADIFLNTNDVDNMPVAVLEAGAMGLPVVSTAVGGIPDLLTQGQTGLLVPPDDPNAMAGGVLRLLEDPALAGRLSANGLWLARQCSWEQVRPQWEQVFKEVLAGSAGTK